MRKILIDGIGVVGLACLAGGLYLEFGLGAALLVCGGLLIALALASAMVAP